MNLSRLAVRVLSYVFALASGLVFLFASATGYRTWLNEFYRTEVSVLQLVVGASSALRPAYSRQRPDTSSAWPSQARTRSAKIARIDLYLFMR